MNPIERRNAFTFAEIMVAAPWLASVLTKSEDNDKAVMLQRNTWADEGSPRVDALKLETLARHERAAWLQRAFARLVARLKSRPRALGSAQAGVAASGWRYARLR
jgi:hypothetical protein